MQADALIIGDSHTHTLHVGCEAAGILFHKVYAGGSTWFKGHYHFSPKAGLTAQAGPQRKKLRALSEEMGFENIFEAGLPVVASFGFNLGMLLSAQELHGHSIISEEGHYDEGADQVLSRDFAARYIDAICGRNFRIIKNIAKVTPLTMVVPPRVDASHNRVQLTQMITARMIQYGATVIDPSMVITGSATKALPEHLIAPDGVHGSDDYGEMAVEILSEHHVFQPQLRAG